jgi:hypothetical protein
MLVVLGTVIGGLALVSADNPGPVDPTPTPRPVITPSPTATPKQTAPTFNPPATPVVTPTTPVTPTPPPDPRIALEDSLYRTALECMRNSASRNTAAASDSVTDIQSSGMNITG